MIGSDFYRCSFAAKMAKAKPHRADLLGQKDGAELSGLQAAPVQLTSRAAEDHAASPRACPPVANDLLQ